MSFLRRLFGRGAPAPGPTTETAETPPLSLPARARIATLRPADGVGTLETDDGVSLRFGVSACPGFDPVEGARVIVQAVGPHPLGGWRATRVIVDPADGARYDQLVTEQHRGHGIERSAGASAAATALTLGWVIVLLDEPLPAGPQALRAWAEPLGLPALGIELATSGGQLSFRLPVENGFRDVLTYPGEDPFDRAQLDLRGMPDDLPLGRGFIGLGLGLPGMARTSRLATPDPADPWGPSGELRQLSRLVLALLRRGCAVVLPRAGAVVVPAGDFAAQLGDLDDPECRPFGAWMSDGIVEGDGGGPALRSSVGLEVSGLPDVTVPLGSSAWQKARSFEALMLAGHLMVRQNRELQPGSVLEVPVGVRCGAWPVDVPAADTPRDAERYTVSAGETLHLTPIAPGLDPGARWAEASDPRRPDPRRIALGTYQALLEVALAGSLGTTLQSHLPCEVAETVPHAMQVHALAAGGFLLATSGLGRRRQSGGEQVDTPHVEVGTYLETHSMEWVSLVGSLGRSLHAPDAEPWRPGDTLRSPVTDLGVAGFALASGGALPMPPGAPVTLLLLVPLNARELDSVRGGGCAAWLARQLGDPLRPQALQARWRSFMPSA